MGTFYFKTQRTENIQRIIVKGTPYKNGRINSDFSRVVGTT
jgi:hypothetical protein